MPIGELVKFSFFLVSDPSNSPSDRLGYDKRRKELRKAPAPNLDNRIGSRSAPAAQPTGCKLQAATADLNGLHVAGLLSLNTNEPTLRRVSDLPSGARLDHPINRSTHHETVVHLLRGRRPVRCVVCSDCCRVAPAELHAQRQSGIRESRPMIVTRSPFDHFTAPMTYKIVRFYAPHLNKSNRVIQRGLTLEEAQEHCKNPSTRKAGEWFDGYDQE